MNLRFECESNELVENAQTGNKSVRCTFRKVEDLIVNGNVVGRDYDTKTYSRLFNLKDGLPEGKTTRGEVVTFETTPYEIGGRMVNKFTMLLLASDTDRIATANAQLKRNNACVVIDGEPTLVLKVASPIGQD